MNEDVGMKIAQAAHGISGAEFEYIRSCVDTLDADGGVLHKQAAALAARMYEATDRRDRFGYHLFRKIATHRGDWSSGYTALVKTVYEALAENSPHVKQAGNSVSWIPELYKNLLLGAVAGGGGVGALTWQAQQDDVEEDDEAAKMQAQLAYLSNVTDSIDDSLRSRGVAA